jgi:hypothetical protein
LTFLQKGFEAQSVCGIMIPHESLSRRAHENTARHLAGIKHIAQCLRRAGLIPAGGLGRAIVEPGLIRAVAVLFADAAACTEAVA